MRQASSAEVAQDFAAYRDIAAGVGAAPESVAVLHRDEPSVVIISAAEYARLKQRDKQVLLTEDVPEWLIEQIAAGEMDPEFAELDEAR